MSIFITRRPDVVCRKPNAPGVLPPPALAMTCHYKNKAQTDVAIKSLIKFHPEVKKIIVVDTSVEQDYTFEDPRVKIINLPNGLHSDGVNFGMDFIYKNQKSRKDKRVLLIDSDVEFFQPIPKLPEAVLIGQIIDKSKMKPSVLPRIHPCFCVMDYGFLAEHKIPFMDWNRITDENQLILSHNPKETVINNPEFPKVRENQKSSWYDVGSTMFEDVKKAGGKIENFDWAKFMYHRHGGSWMR